MPVILDRLFTFKRDTLVHGLKLHAQGWRCSRWLGGLSGGLSEKETGGELA